MVVKRDSETTDRRLSLTKRSSLGMHIQRANKAIDDRKLWGVAITIGVILVTLVSQHKVFNSVPYVLFC